MNIFALSNDPVEAAQLQCDRHIVKMVVESAQMLSTAHRMLDGELIETLTKTGRKGRHYKLPDYREDLFYKAVHYHHPCTVWTMKSNNNYTWHWIHFAALCDEYTYRYGKVHKTDLVLREELQNLPRNISVGPKTPLPLAMKSNPECMKEDVVESYRLFYQTKQHRFKMKWSKRPVPEWFRIIEA